MVGFTRPSNLPWHSYALALSCMFGQTHWALTDVCCGASAGIDGWLLGIDLWQYQQQNNQ